ncbi:MAG: hypothetical protein Kow0098_22590 [Ignavibacteriaceae bacterium]
MLTENDLSISVKIILTVNFKIKFVYLLKLINQTITGNKHDKREGS